MQHSAPYIQLPHRQKMGVILGTSFLHFYNLIITFTMPVALPVLMGRYDMMAFYAILGGITALLGCIVTPIGGKLGDLLGRRKVFLIAGYLRLVLMLLCALPGNGTTFFILYVVGNFFASALSAYPTTVLSDVTLPEERPRWFGVFGTINGGALVVGLLGGGIMVDLLGPMSVFLFSAPFGLVGLILLTLYYPNRPSAEKTKLDSGGIILLAIGFTCILSWCAFGGTLFKRTSALGLALIVVGLIMLVILYCYERRTKDPLLDFTLFRNKHFTVAFFTYLAIAPMVQLCASTLVLYGQVSLGLSATVSGTLALPKNLVFFILPTFLGAWLARDSRRFRAVFLLCGGTIAIASALSATWTVNTSIFTIYVVMLIYGVATSCQSVCVQPYMQLAIQPADLGRATGMILFGSSIGSTIFNSAYNVFYNYKYAAAMELGGGVHLAQAVSETFSLLSVLSAVCGVGILVLALTLIPRVKAKKTSHAA